MNFRAHFLIFVILSAIGSVCLASPEASDAPALYDQARLLAGQKEFVKARELYERVVELLPASAEAHNGLGYVCYELGDLSRAEREYNRAIDLDPDLAQAYNNLGIISYHRGDYASAEVHYKKAIKLKPNYAKAIVNLASVYVKQGNYWGAWLEYCNALNVDRAYVEERKRSARAREEIKDLQDRYAKGEISIEAQ